MKFPLFLAFTTSLIWLSLQNCTQAGKVLSSKPNEDVKNVLAAYGESLYQREKCGACHTLYQPDANGKIVSLDGLGGKYPESWHYYMLSDPEMLIPGASMPAYRHLHNQPLRQEYLAKMNLTGSLTSHWAALVTQADSMYQVISDQGSVPQKRTEVLAMIAYLQQIPGSSAKKLADSLALVHENERQQQLSLSFEDAKENIFLIAQNQNNVPAGAQTFKALCSICHGPQGGGAVGPNLTDQYWLHGGKPGEIAGTIFNGVPEKGMIAWRYHLTPKEIGELLAYIVSIQGSNPAHAKAPQGVRE